MASLYTGYKLRWRHYEYFPKSESKDNSSPKFFFGFTLFIRLRISHRIWRHRRWILVRKEAVRKPHASASATHLWEPRGPISLVSGEEAPPIQLDDQLIPSQLAAAGGREEERTAGCHSDGKLANL